MKIKPNTYYKDYFSDIKEYNIVYTDDEWCYVLAYVRINQQIIVRPKNEVWWTIKSWQKEIDKDKNINKTLTEISKEDVFLELL